MKQSYMAFLVFLACIASPLSGAEAQTQSSAEKQKMAENFIQADANGDKMLTRDEFNRFIQLNAQDNLGQAAQIVRFGRQGMAFSRIDADRNGVLTRQELQAIAQ